MEKQLFKYNHYAYVVLRHEASNSLWAYNKGSPYQHSPPFYFLGSFKDGELEPIRNTDKLPWDVIRGMERLYRRVIIDYNDKKEYIQCTNVNQEMNTEIKKMQDTVDELNSRHGKFYKIKKCESCGKDHVAGTNKINCDDCGYKVWKDANKAQKFAHAAKKEIVKKEKMECFMCKSKEGTIEMHHIDKDRFNNKLDNLVLLCRGCHRKIHGRIYSPLFKRVFKILIDQRFSYEEIGKMFNTSKQNVYNIIKRNELSTENFTDVN